VTVLFADLKGSTELIEGLDPEEVRRSHGLEMPARMEQLTTPGSILLTAATLQLVEGLVQVHALDPMPVKGLVEPIEVFELVRVSALRRRLTYRGR
jgi:class 3 adenylate cyclase